MDINIGIIGAGAISELGHIPSVIGTDGVSLRALVDVNENRLSYLKNKFKIEYCTTDFEKVIDNVDSIIIATPPHTHEPIAKRAFEAGLNVLCEKPLANNVSKCEKILHYADDLGKKLAVGHVYRFMPNRQHLYSLIKDNLGRIKEIRIRQGSKADWPTLTGYSFRKELVPGGVLLNEGIHSLDFIYWLLGYPDQIEYLDDSIGGLESNCEINLTQGNIKSSFKLSRTCSLSNTIEIVSEDSTIKFPIYNMNSLNFYKKDKKDVLKLEYADFNIVDLLKYQLQDFKNSLEHNKNPLVSGIDGLNIIKIIEDCYRIKKGRKLPKSAPIPGMVW
jgi:predicted dehydrogenase